MAELIAGRVAKSLLLIGVLACVGCVDNATKLRARVEREVARLGVGEEDLEVLVPYEPVRDNGRPYWLILTPDWQFSVADLVAAGLDEDVAIRIFQDLAYIDFGDQRRGPNLVVLQDGRRLNFTRTWRPRANQVLVERRQGPCEIVLQRRWAEWEVVGVR